MNSVISIQPRVSKLSGGKSPDESVTDIALDIESRLPPPLDRARAHASTFAVVHDGSMNSLGVFLLNEMVRFNRLLSVMRATLKELQRAIKGLVVMSGATGGFCLLCFVLCQFFYILLLAAELEAMYSRFLYNVVPVAWEKVAYPSIKPLFSWVDDLLARLKFLDTWLTAGAPSAFWVSGFFFPQGFMTAVLQFHSRHHRLAIDKLKFRTSVLDTSVETIRVQPQSGTFFPAVLVEIFRHVFLSAGVYVYGFFMQGARSVCFAHKYFCCEC